MKVACGQRKGPALGLLPLAGSIRRVPVALSRNAARRDF